jgi:hypothetical protein
MYSSVSEAEYQFRRARAEEEAKNAYGRSREAREEHCSQTDPPPLARGRLGSLLSHVQEDDLLILGLLFLLLNENKDDDPLILIVLAALFLT